MAEHSSTRLGALVAVVVVLGLFLAVTDAATYYTSDPCPAGIAYQESWFPEDQKCTRCTCFSGNGYGCSTCGSVAFPSNSPNCYVEVIDPNARYPDCCRKRQLCPGDSGYDPSKASGNVV